MLAVGDHLSLVHILVIIYLPRASLKELFLPPLLATHTHFTIQDLSATSLVDVRAAGLSVEGAGKSRLPRPQTLHNSKEP